MFNSKKTPANSTNTRSPFMSNKGSSSMLVILIMLTLIVFGVLAMMSTFSNLKLSRKTAENTASHYRLDKKGVEVLSSIINSIKIAKENTLTQSASSDNLTKIKDLYASNIQKELTSLYKTAKKDDNRISIHWHQDVSIDFPLDINVSIKSDDKSYQKSLDFGISIISDAVNTTLDKASDDSSLYKIKYWKESPATFTNTSEIGFTNPGE